jgi:hypothetical protein
MTPTQPRLTMHELTIPDHLRPGPIVAVSDTNTARDKADADAAARARALAEYMAKVNAGRGRR